MNRLKLCVLSCFVFLVSSAVSADTIIKFGLGGVSPDVKYEAGVLSTIGDGNAATVGDQDTDVEFVGFLDGVFADIIAGASLSLSGVTANGAATVLGSLVLQQTVGGSFSVYSPTNNLLLSGLLTDGVISGSTGSTAGSFFNTTVATFTGGSLLAYVATSPAGFSISFTDIASSGVAGLAVNGRTLGNFTADATGQIEAATAVPEPASMALLVSGVLGGIARRRKSA